MNIHTKKDFAAAINYSRTSTSLALSGNDSYLTDNLFKKIDKAFPEIFNLDWLLTGEGEMLVSGSRTEPRKELSKLINDIIGVPLVSQYAHAGYLSGYADAEYLETLPMIPFVPDRKMTGNYVAFEVKGDSMDDGSRESYKAGDILICREVEPDYYKTCQLHINRRDFVIVHTDGILVKRIINHDVDAHTITIHSLNELYHDEVLNLNDVKQIFSVVTRQSNMLR